jgi:hypothetical protein
MKALSRDVRFAFNKAAEALIIVFGDNQLELQCVLLDMWAPREPPKRPAMPPRLRIITRRSSL